MIGIGAVGKRIYGDASARREESCHLQIQRIHEPEKVVGNDIDAVLMKIAMVAEAEKIEFQALALHHALTWHIADYYACKIRLTGDRAKRCEFRAVETYHIFLARMLVDKCLKYIRAIIGRIFIY